MSTKAPGLAGLLSSGLWGGTAKVLPAQVRDGFVDSGVLPSLPASAPAPWAPGSREEHPWGSGRAVFPKPKPASAPAGACGQYSTVGGAWKLTKPCHPIISLPLAGPSGS